MHIKKRLKKIFLFQIKGRYLNHDSNEAISKLPKTMRESLKNLDKNDIAGAILVSTVVFITYYIINLIATI